MGVGCYPTPAMSTRKEAPMDTSTTLTLSEMVERERQAQNIRRGCQDYVLTLIEKGRNKR